MTLPCPDVVSLHAQTGQIAAPDQHDAQYRVPANRQLPSAAPADRRDPADVRVRLLLRSKPIAARRCA